MSYSTRFFDLALRDLKSSFIIRSDSPINSDPPSLTRGGGGSDSSAGDRSDDYSETSLRDEIDWGLVGIFENHRTSFSRCTAISRIVFNKAARVL